MIMDIRACRLISALVLTIGPEAALSHELNTFIGFEYEYSDNMRRLPPPSEMDDSRLSPRIEIDYLLDYADFDATLAYSASREIYDKESFEDRTDVLGEGTFRWAIASSRLFWDFYQNRNRLTIDSQETDVPDNQTERNVIRTGPVLQFQSGRQVFMLSANYVDTSFDSATLLETSQRQYRGLYRLPVSATSEFELEATHADVESDNAVLDYTSERYGVTFRGQGQKHRYAASVGYNAIDRDAGTSFSGVFTSAYYMFEADAFTFRISASRELTDSAIGLSLNDAVADPLNNGDTDFDLSDVVERGRYEATFEYGVPAGRASFGLTAYLDRHDYQTLDEDHDSKGATFTFGYALSPRLDFGYRVEATREEFELLPGVPDESYDDVEHRIDLRYRPNSRLTFDLWGAEGEREFVSGDPSLEESRGGVTVSWLL